MEKPDPPTTPQPLTFPKRILDQPEVGSRASFTRTITEGDVAIFIGVTWDVNPYHTDEIFASQTKFAHRIVPGLLTAGLLTHLGGLWAFLATEMHFKFLAPVYIGDTITASAEIVEFAPERGWVRLDCECRNAAGSLVLKADVSGFPRGLGS
jgi:3-hydroxybutyryl-CoA dehydratase